VRETIEAEQAEGAAAERAAHAASPQPLRAVPLVLRTVKEWMADWLRTRGRAAGASD
jgi:hypothetical protein